jgi:hypothetical protein
VGQQGQTIESYRQRTRFLGKSSTITRRVDKVSLYSSWASLAPLWKENARLERMDNTVFEMTDYRIMEISTVSLELRFTWFKQQGVYQNLTKHGRWG